MKLETFVEKFDLFVEAPGGVGKLRELVLELAIRGNLVPQGAEPASSRSCSALHEENAPESRQGETGFAALEIPASWARCTLSRVADCRAAGKVSSKDIRADDWVLDLEDIDGDRGHVTHFATFAERRSLSTKAAFAAGEVLYGKLRPYLNKVVVAPKAGFCTTEIVPLRPAPGLLPEFLRLYLRSRTFLNYSKSKSYGMKMPRLGTKDLEGALVPVPPPEEQALIVAKADELLALCDRLEGHQHERETRHAALTQTSLARFSDAPNPTSLNFLFHDSYTIEPAALRSSIVALAVQGKLVPQEREEAVSALVARISAKRRETGAKQYEAVESAEAPYEIPASWLWIRLGNLALKSDAGWSPQCLPQPRAGTDWGVLKISAVSWGTFRPEENKALGPGMAGRAECEVHPGDFLLSRANTAELVARSVVVDQAPPRLMMSDKIVRFVFPSDVDSAFVNLVNLSEPSRAYYARNASGTSSSMKNVGREVMCNLPIPLPPKAEQRRIVARVKQLLALVDELQRLMVSSHLAAEILAEAIVGELTYANGEGLT